VTQPLLIEHSDGLDRVTLNRPESLNALEDFGEGIRAFLEKRKPVYIRR
jgi:enoyl-CoA hydratase/carnithine racemase